MLQINNARSITEASMRKSVIIFAIIPMAFAAAIMQFTQATAKDTGEKNDTPGVKNIKRLVPLTTSVPYMLIIGSSY